MFTPSKELLEDIETRDIQHIRNEFTTIAHEDRSFSTGKFDATLEYVISKNIEGVIVPFDQEIFKSREEWDRDYWAILVASLMDNFCMERINHLKEVSKAVYFRRPSAVVTQANTQRPTVVYGEQKRKKTVPIALIVGLAIACIAAVIVIGRK